MLRLAPATLPFPTSTPTVEAGDDGVLRTPDGAPISRDVVVTPSTITLAGEKLAERPVGDSEAYGLTAWRPATPTRMLLRVDGLLPNGDFTGHARMTVFDCRPGTLDVTILGKTGDPIRAYVDGFEVATLETPAEERGDAPDSGTALCQRQTPVHLRPRESRLRRDDDDRVLAERGL